MTQSKRVDANQVEIVSALRKAGAQVDITSMVGGGFPDIIAFYAGGIYPIEIKTVNGKLTPEQVKWHAEHKRYVDVVHTAEQALIVIGAI